MADIIRGTTPTIKFTFSSVSVADIEVAYLTIRQSGSVVIEHSIEDATVDGEEGTLTWTLSQEDTLKLAAGEKASAVCDWRLQSGTRGRSKIALYTVSDTGKDEVI